MSLEIVDLHRKWEAILEEEGLGVINRHRTQCSKGHSLIEGNNVPPGFSIISDPCPFCSRNSQ